MAGANPEAKACVRCYRDIAAGELACPHCQALVHRLELERISRDATSLEQQADLAEATARWNQALSLLPPTSAQSNWIRNHVLHLELSLAEATAPKPESPVDKWIKKMGPLASLGMLLGKLKPILALLKFNFIFSFVAFIAFYWSSFGPKYGIGIAMLVLAHELGHYIDAKRRLLHVDLPIFLPGLGAFVKWKGEGVSADVRAGVSLAGPAFGAISAVVCAALWWTTKTPIWAALARTAAWFNAFNLIPVAILDGAGVFPVLGTAGRVTVVTVGLMLWQSTGLGVFALVAVAGAWYTLRVEGSKGQLQSVALTMGFVAALSVLATVMWMVPHLGRGALR
jgi:Zn-dependent protease